MASFSCSRDGKHVTPKVPSRARLYGPPPIVVRAEARSGAGAERRNQTTKRIREREKEIEEGDAHSRVIDSRCRHSAPMYRKTSISECMCAFLLSRSLADDDGRTADKRTQVVTPSARRNRRKSLYLTTPTCRRPPVRTTVETGRITRRAAQQTPATRQCFSLAMTIMAEASGGRARR